MGALVDRGVVSWDAPVGSFAPAMESRSLMPLQMRACGTTSRIEPAYRPMQGILAQLGLSSAELVRRARFLPFGHSFRSRWGYSNYGVFLGHYSCAQAAGTTAPDSLSREISPRWA